MPQFGVSALFAFSTMTGPAFMTQRMFSPFGTAVMSLKESPSTVSFQVQIRADDSSKA
jgi:hypothetical protein